MKKLYESPVVEVCILTAAENLMTLPSVSDTGYGWEDGGPLQEVTPVS